jgi:hypothetical protein
MASRHRVSIARCGASDRAFFSIAALGLLASAIMPASAQPAAPAEPVPMPPPSTFQTRIEAAAEALQSNPRLKGLNQQQRVERVDFVV